MTRRNNQLDESTYEINSRLRHHTYGIVRRISLKANILSEWNDNKVNAVLNTNDHAFTITVFNGIT